MAARETGKQRASKIPLDYFRHANSLERWRLWFAGAAIVSCLLWIATGLIEGQAAQSRYSPGPLALAHAMWDDRCEACHIPFQPIQNRSVVAALVGSSEGSSARCRNCHEGPPHHVNQLTDAKQGQTIEDCASCHHEHGGRDGSLVKLADRSCTDCHAKLSEHCRDGKTTFENVARFDRDQHPEFRFLRERRGDPGHLKFNHALHMSPGMLLRGRPDPRWTLGQIPAVDRGRYRRPGQRDADRVQMECASCHRLDSLDAGLPLLSNGLPVEPAGAYYLPISYDNHCRACHPLTLPSQQGVARLIAPHGLQPGELHAKLFDAYLAQYVHRGGALLDSATAPAPLPGHLPTPETEQVHRHIDQQVYQVEKLLYIGRQSCGECHEFKSDVKSPIEAMFVGKAPMLEVVATNVPVKWFENARFDHTAHRAIDCRQCHERAFPDSADASIVSGNVLLPGIALCTTCHTSASGGRGMARADCTECHRYHHREDRRARLQGAGAAAHGPLRRLDIGAFISGGGNEVP